MSALEMGFREDCEALLVCAHGALSNFISRLRLSRGPSESRKSAQTADRRVHAGCKRDPKLASSLTTK